MNAYLQRVLYLSGILLLLGGCATARMPVDEELSSAAPLDVEGRQGWKIHERLRFGEFDSGEIERSWTRGPSLNVMGVYQGDRRRQQFTFVLLDRGRAEWDVTCEARLHRRTLQGSVDIELRNRSGLDCELVSRARHGAIWRMALSERGERPLAGLLVHDRDTLEVRGTDRLRKALPYGQTTGYHLRERGRSVAAVEVINDGRVWLGDRLPADRRRLLAATSTVLLVVEDLRSHLEENG